MFAQKSRGNHRTLVIADIFAAEHQGDQIEFAIEPDQDFGALT